ESWWVIRERDDSYVLMKELVLSRTYYSVSKTEVRLHIPVERSKYPINLKAWDIEYLGATTPRAARVVQGPAPQGIQVPRKKESIDHWLIPQTPEQLKWPSDAWWEFTEDGSPGSGYMC